MPKNKIKIVSRWRPIKHFKMAFSRQKSECGLLLLFCMAIFQIVITLLKHFKRKNKNNNKEKEREKKKRC